ncbi:MAG: hypothetical protein JNL09_07210 [Anaerolineales bacterium]|nr:hypothetical protein [Anaerolineales bacterium]
MEELIRAVVVIILGCVLIVPFVLSFNALFPRRIARTRTIAEQMPGRAFAVGLINLLFFGAVALGFSALADAIGNELPRLPALLIFTILLIALSFGLTAVARLVGERLRPQASDLNRTIVGTLALSLGSTLPVVGWFALLPYAAGLGLGAFILSFIVREKPPVN